jgi:LPXTG-site transpeptidase (sortase) family protein
MSSQRTRSSWRLISLRLVLVITLITVTIIVIANLNNSPEPPKKISTVVTKPVDKQELTPGLPIRLKIQKINVDAVIDYTGLTADGAMDVKKDPDKVAWYSLGPRPGQIGSAVIAGHYGWIEDKGSVFNELQTLIKGDEITVVDEKGVINNFLVREIKHYKPDATVPEVFMSNDKKSHLNLITCNGTWDEAKQTYSNRLVIFTDKKI